MWGYVKESEVMLQYFFLNQWNNLDTILYTLLREEIFYGREKVLRLIQIGQEV